MSAFEGASKILILGGTGDANEITLALKSDPKLKIEIILSLAGRTKKPSLPIDQVIMGGFGGIGGLKEYLQKAQISAVVDATHPFASQITDNAYSACTDLNIPLCRFERPAWVKQPGDIWHNVKDIAAAVEMAPRLGKSILLTTGSKDLARFMVMKDVKVFTRMIHMPNDIILPAYFTPILARGPFDLDAEIALICQYKIDLIIAKNSGGTATVAKIQAARKLKIPVLLVDRPDLPPIYAIDTIDAIANWLKSNF